MRASLAAVCLVLSSWAAFAQTDRGTITGTITDPAGAVIPNAPIQAINVNTGAVYSAAASGTGNYTIPQLPVGTYEVSVAVPGFKKYTRTGIGVEVAGTLLLAALVGAKIPTGQCIDSVNVLPAKPIDSPELGHHCEVARSPMILPKIDSTTDHPIQ